MLNNKDTILPQLKALNLTSDEAKIYLELLKGPKSHLALARATGINRTKVYRLADSLEKRSLVGTQTDDRGTFLIAGDPTTLEIELVTQEESLKNQRTVFNKLLPMLNSFKDQSTGLNFTINTYEGVEGFKQMLWHELKTDGEELIFGSGTIEDLVPQRRWAEKHRTRTVEANYSIREVLNPGEKEVPFTLNSKFMSRYTYRTIPPALLLLKHQIAIYNDTVTTYCWRDDQKVGLEVINHEYAQMMRQVFEQYWQLASVGD